MTYLPSMEMLIRRTPIFFRLGIEKLFERPIDQNINMGENIVNTWIVSSIRVPSVLPL